MFTYNDLLIEILNMTPDERKEPVMFTDSEVWAPERAQNVGKVYWHFGSIYLMKG